MDISYQKILEYLKGQGGRGASFKELLAYFGLKASEGRALKATLRQMGKAGLLLRSRGRTFRLSAGSGVVSGTISVHPDGFGFVSPGQGGQDVYLPSSELKEVIHGDKVLVRVRKRGPAGRREGALLGIAARGLRELVGRLIDARGRHWVVPSDPRIQHRFQLAASDRVAGREGELVVCRITAYPTRHRPGTGEVTRFLGPEGTPEADVQILVHRHGLPSEFREGAKLEAARFPESVPPGELEGRVDLRSVPFFTVDPVDARDFDDAIAIEALPSGGYRLLISIADVSHYVEPGTAIDLEAFERGTSVYFPHTAIPMLPESLSMKLCSLLEGEDRLSVTVVMEFDHDGQQRDCNLFRSVMRGAARLTFDQVKGLLTDGDPGLGERYSSLLPSLRVMEDLCRKLASRREKRGSLDFDLPEPQFILDSQGRPEEIVRAERNIAHRIIEEFMVAANEAVASHLSGKGAPFLYRVHEPPDMERFNELKLFLKEIGIGAKLGSRPDPAHYQKVLAELAGGPVELIVSRFLLRSLKQARYSHENLRHFGLASPCYTHFTSPIRRYPDLIVHRALKWTMDGAKGLPTLGPPDLSLESMAYHLSDRERVAMEAEREMCDLRRAQFMADKLGQEFRGLVVGIAPFGFFVELHDYFVEGFVPLDSLADDYYQADPQMRLLKGRRRGRTIHLGDEVRIRVRRVDLGRRRVECDLVAWPQRAKGRPSAGLKGLDKQRLVL